MGAHSLGNCPPRVPLGPKLERNSVAPRLRCSRRSATQQGKVMYTMQRPPMTTLGEAPLFVPWLGRMNVKPAMNRPATHHGRMFAAKVTVNFLAVLHPEPRTSNVVGAYPAAGIRAESLAGTGCAQESRRTSTRVAMRRQTSPPSCRSPSAMKQGGAT